MPSGRAVSYGSHNRIMKSFDTLIKHSLVWSEIAAQLIQWRQWSRFRFYLTVWPTKQQNPRPAFDKAKRWLFVNRYYLRIIHVRQSNGTGANRIEVERLVLSFGSQDPHDWVGLFVNWRLIRSPDDYDEKLLNFKVILKEAKVYEGRLAYIIKDLRNNIKIFKFH